MHNAFFVCGNTGVNLSEISHWTIFDGTMCFAMKNGREVSLRPEREKSVYDLEKAVLAAIKESSP